MPYDGKKKRRFGKFRIDFISNVDNPAQAGAVAVLRKRADTPDESTAPGPVHVVDSYEIDKRHRLTSTGKGHQHLVYMGPGMDGGHTDYVESDAGFHSHPWTLNDDGTVSIGRAAGHSHSEVIMKSAAGGGEPEELDMADNTSPATDAQVERLTVELAKATAFGELSDAQKAHYRTLSDAQADRFLKMSPVERQAEVDKAAESDTVLYKCADGTEIRKSDGQRAAALAKRADELEERLAKSEAIEKNARFAKRAQDELSHLAGGELAKVALLAAVDSIEDDEVRESVTEMLRGADNATSGAFVSKGATGGDDTDGSAKAEFEAYAKKFAEDHKISIGEAYGKAMVTPEGAALWEAQRAEMQGVR